MQGADPRAFVLGFGFEKVLPFCQIDNILQSEQLTVEFKQFRLAHQRIESSIKLGQVVEVGVYKKVDEVSSTTR